MSTFEDFSEDLSVPTGSFNPVETLNLPEYTQLAIFNLGDETIETSHPEDPEASKFTPRSARERLSLIRAHVGALVGSDAELISDEFLINGVSPGEDKAVPEITTLSIGVLATGEVVVVATDKSKGIIPNPNRQKSINPATGAKDTARLTGTALDEVLKDTGVSGRGFMIATALSVGGVHYTPTKEGKHVWAVIKSSDDTQLAA